MREQKEKNQSSEWVEADRDRGHVQTQTLNCALKIEKGDEKGVGNERERLCSLLVCVFACYPVHLFESRRKRTNQASVWKRDNEERERLNKERGERSG